MPQIVKAQIPDLKQVTRSGKRRTNALWVVREDVFAVSRLTLNYRPRLRGVLEAAVISFSCGRVFGVAHHACLATVVIFATLGGKSRTPDAPSAAQTLLCSSSGSGNDDRGV